jgi:arsenite methyltransferase
VGNPVRYARLQPGQAVLDVGSGGGIDTILAARRVGPQGRAIGLDLLEEMCERSRRHAAQAGVESGIEFLQGGDGAHPAARCLGGRGDLQRGAEPVSAQEPALAEIFTDVWVGGHQPFGIDQAALYPLFTPEVIQVMRRTIPANHQDHVATGVIVKARKPG